MMQHELKNGSHKQKSMEALTFHGINNATSRSWNVLPYVGGIFTHGKKRNLCLVLRARVR
jgi:hypothetical protein